MNHAIGIVGYGFVGRAVEYGFKGDSFFIYDKYKDMLPLKEVCQNSEFIFVCVPTPMKEDESGIDLTIVEDVVAEIAKLIKGTDKIIVLKSTVIPGTTKKLIEKHPGVNICFNPEFLTEANYLEDFVNADRVVVGADNDLTSRRLVVLYKDHFPKIPVFQTDPTSAEMVKYMANAYLATKVTFANEMFQVCEKLGINYPEVKKMVVADRRIHDSHLDITTQRGFGGKCLAAGERVFVFNNKKLKIIKADGFTDRVAGVLGWKDGKIIKDSLLMTGTRRVNSLLKFSLTKGRNLTVTQDHIMVVADKSGNLIEKEAGAVTKEDYLPIILDGFKGSSKEQVIRLYHEVDLSNHKVFVEGFPKSEAEVLKPFLSFHQFKSLKRTRDYSVPFKACLKAGINIDEYRIKTSKTGTWIPSVIRINDTFARLVGYYLSEGCVSDGRLFFSFSYKEVDLLEDIQGILNNLKIQFSFMKTKWKGQESAVSIKISSQILSSFFSKFGINSYDKIVPSFVFHSSQNIKDQVLAGALRGDGSISRSNKGDYWTINYATSSQILAEGIDALLREKGILSSVGRIKTTKAKVPAWSLDISEMKNVQALLPLFTTRQKDKLDSRQGRSIKSPAYSKIKNLALVGIKAIQKLKKSSLVYSIETANHYYVTSWGILTHNCLPKDLIALRGLAKKLEVDTTLLDNVWKKNLAVRKVRDWEEIPFVVSKGAPNKDGKS